MRDLRDARRRLAIVVDEYGGTAGIVALEAVLDGARRRDRGHVRRCRAPGAPGGTLTFDDADEALGTPLDDTGARTPAGPLSNALGRRPREGDVDGVCLHVEHVEGHGTTRPLVRVCCEGSRLDAAAQT